jgi:hypothetical protein
MRRLLLDVIVALLRIAERLVLACGRPPAPEEPDELSLDEEHVEVWEPPIMARVTVTDPNTRVTRIVPPTSGDTPS